MPMPPEFGTYGKSIMCKTFDFDVETQLVFSPYGKSGGSRTMRVVQAISIVVWRRWQIKQAQNTSATRTQPANVWHLW